MTLPHGGTYTESQGLATSSERDEEGTQVLRHLLAASSTHPPQGRGCGLDAFRATVHLPQSPSPNLPVSSSSAMRSVMDFSQGHPFPSPPTPLSLF